MLHPVDWFSRPFDFNLPLWMYPNIVERLRGTPARLETRVAGLPKAILTRRLGDRWSIQENVGHLLDLEGLWLGRVVDFEQKLPRLRVADLDNRKTYEADHNAHPLQDILANFRAERAKLVQRLESADEAFIQQSALHPRLDASMRLIDHAYFVAEHDDHHLVEITALIKMFMP
ncbi:MAG: DinB family protein [Chloroflexi bacterium]|nr:DinB family protein [Chloroflexota bacterium]